MQFDNLLALWIAIEYKKPAEIAFQILDFLHEKGRMPERIKKFRLTKEELEDVHAFRLENISWDKIADVMGHKSSSHIYIQYHKYYPKEERRC